MIHVNLRGAVSVILRCNANADVVTTKDQLPKFYK